MERATLSVHETAEWLGLNVKSVYAGIRAGQIPSVRIGGRVLVSKAALERLLDHVPGNAR